MMKYTMLKESLQLLQHLLQRDEQHQLAINNNKYSETVSVSVCVCVVAGLEVAAPSALWVTLKLQMLAEFAQASMMSSYNVGWQRYSVHAHYHHPHHVARPEDLCD